MRQIHLQSIGLVLAIFVVSVLLLISIIVLFCWEDGHDAHSELVKQKSFSRVIAEGLRYRDYQSFGVDRFAFKSCRIEKRRKGAITLGAFNVLVVDGLVLNLPAVASVSIKGEPARESSFGWIKGDGLGETLVGSQGLGVGRISGIRINGLTVNRCNNTNGVSLIFSATLAESGMSKEGLHLQGCEVSTPDGSQMRVNKARLILKPAPKLVYVRRGVEESIGL